jgi:hypothetical protein
MPKSKKNIEAYENKQSGVDKDQPPKPPKKKEHNMMLRGKVRPKNQLRKRITNEPQALL